MFSNGTKDTKKTSVVSGFSRTSVVIAAAIVLGLVPVCATAQDRVDPMAGTVAQWLSMIEKSFVGLADAMPADKYGFKPTNGAFKDARTFAEQVKHVACANFAFYNEIEKKTPPEGCETGGPSPAKTKAELMVYLRESFAYAGRVLKTLTPANAMEPVSGPYGGDSTRLGSLLSPSGTPRITTASSSSICA